MDPNEPIPGRDRWITDPDLFPNELPEGVTKDAKTWYAFERTFRDGRKVIQWFKRGSGPVVDGKPQDPVFTEQTAVVPSIAKEWEQTQKESQKPPETRNINGVPHTVTGKDESGQPIWSPVQTATGPAQAAGSPAQAAAPGGAPFKDDGPEAGKMGRRWGWNPETRLYDRDLGPSPAAQAPEQPKPPTERVNPADPARRQVWNPSASNGAGAWEDAGAVATKPEEVKPPQERVNPADPTRRQVWNPQAGAGKGAWEDAGVVAQKPEENKPPAERVNPADPTRRQVWNPRGGDGRGTWEDAGAVAQKPATPTTRYNPDTGEYEQVTTDAQGKPVVRTVPREGQAPTAPGQRAPSLPQIVVGASQDALRQGYDDIQAEVDAGRKTPAWGENRRKELFQAAQLTVQESQLHEQSRQYNQTASFNAAQYGSNALESSMKFALSINGKLKPGSSAGANLFRAMFTMQMKMLADSGFQPGGGQSSVGTGYPGASGAPSTQADRRPPPRVTDIGDPAKVAEQADKAEAELAAHPVINPQTAAPSSLTIAPPTEAAPPGAPEMPVSPTAPTARPEPLFRPQPPVTTPPPAPEPVGVAQPAGQQAFNAAGSMLERAATRQPTQEFDAYPALEQFRMGDTQPRIDPITPPVVVPPNPMDQQVGMAPAIQRAQIRVTPPWRLPVDQLGNLIQQYGEEDIFHWPGRELLGA